MDLYNLGYWEPLFKYDHLPKHLQEVSKPFYQLAVEITMKTPSKQLGNLSSVMPAIIGLTMSV